METKKMTVANVNMVFGKQEEPMIYHIDDIIIPAMNGNNERKAGSKTRYFFEDVKVRKIKGEYVLAGLFIKDTVLEALSEYDDVTGLKHIDKRMSSAPFSLFMIFLRNHRMVLVKNQMGSPDIRNFRSALYEILNAYISKENEKRKQSNEEFLLRPMHIAVTGITTQYNVKEVLKDVEKVESLTLKFHPLNGEWDLDSLYGEVDNVRKKTGSKTGKMIFNSPGNIDAVAEMIEESDGLAEPQMKVRYRGDVSLSGTKRTATIKGSQISENMNVDIVGDLETAYEEIYDSKKDIKSLNIESQNNIVYYEEFLRKRNK